MMRLLKSLAGLMLAPLLFLSPFLPVSAGEGEEDALKNLVLTHIKTSISMDVLQDLDCFSEDAQVLMPGGIVINKDLMKKTATFVLSLRKGDIVEVITAILSLQGHTLTPEQSAQLEKLRGSEQEKQIIAQIQTNFAAKKKAAEAELKTMKFELVSVNGNQGKVSATRYSPLLKMTFRDDYTFRKENGKWRITKKVISKVNPAPEKNESKNKPGKI